MRFDDDDDRTDYDDDDHHTNYYDDDGNEVNGFDVSVFSLTLVAC